MGCSANGRRSDKICDVYINDLVNWASKMERKQGYARFFKNKPRKWCSICTSEMLFLSGVNVSESYIPHNNVLILIFMYCITNTYQSCF